MAKAITSHTFQLSIMTTMEDDEIMDILWSMMMEETIIFSRALRNIDNERIQLTAIIKNDMNTTIELRRSHDAVSNLKQMNIEKDKRDIANSIERALIQTDNWKQVEVSISHVPSFSLEIDQNNFEKYLAIIKVKGI